MHEIGNILYYIFIVMTGISSQSTHYYAFWSGLAPSLSLFGGIGMFFKHLNCHVVGCKSVITAVDPSHGWRACKKHHTRKDDIGVNPHA